MDLIYWVTIIGALIICWNAMRITTLKKTIKEIQAIQRGEDVEGEEQYY